MPQTPAYFDGKRVRTAQLEVRALASLLHAHRIGIVVPRHKHSAVDRNRLKRRLRELTRATWTPQFEAAKPMDVVLYALPSAYAADFLQLREAVTTLGGRVVALAPTTS